MPSRKKRRPIARRPAAPARRRHRRPGALTALVVVVAAGTVAYAALSVGGTEAAPVSERMVTVSRGVISSVVSGSGNLEPARQLDVNFEATGKITKVYASEGAHVSKGELLARLDDRAAAVALAKAQADLTDAEDALASAQEAEASATTASGAAGGSSQPGATDTGQPGAAGGPPGGGFPLGALCEDGDRQQQQGTRGRFGGGQTGQVTAVGKDSITLTGPMGETTVALDAQTTINKSATGKVADIKAGDSVLVAGATQGAATSVTILPAGGN